MSGALLEVSGLVRRFGGFTAVDGVDLQVSAGERVGIIGPNGSGKTTLIQCIAGALRPDAGRVRLAGADVTAWPPHRRARQGLARTFQIPRPFASLSVAGNVAVPLEFVAPRPARPDAEVTRLLARVGLEAAAARPAGSLSQVDLRRLELARALAARPRLLLLDEVMAGLSTDEVDGVLDLVRALNAEGVAVVMIEHIMRAVMGFSERVLCLDAGRVVAEGAPAAILEDPRVRRIYLGDAADG